jgi:hypothetical protein
VRRKKSERKFVKFTVGVGAENLLDPSMEADGF